MPDIAIIVIVAALAGGLGFAVSLLGRARGAFAPLEPAAPEARPRPEAPGEPGLHEVAARLGRAYGSAAYASDLLNEPLFAHGVGLLRDPSQTAETLLGYYTGDNAVLAVLALEALARRDGDPDVRSRILDGINDYVPWTRYFALRVLDARTPAGEPIVGRLLTAIDGSWNVPLNQRILREFLDKRSRGGESLSFGSELERLDEEKADTLAGFFERMPSALVQPLRDEIARWRSTHIDLRSLESVGRVWSPGRSESPILRHAALDAHVGQVASILTRSPRRSVLLVGEHGVGKTAIAQAAAGELASKGWVVWEAGHGELIAGMIYIGELEERLRSLLGTLSRRRVLWIVKNFHALALAGRHKYGPLSVLDYLIPHIESGDVVLLGETQPRAYERLVKDKPRVLTAIETLRIDPLPEAETLQLVDRWAEAHTTAGGEPPLEPGTRREAWLLAEQYLGNRAAPGNVLSLLELTRRRRAATASGSAIRLGPGDLVTTLSRLTGLPATVLDERQGLNLAELRSHFESRVKGQPEAIDCLVERVAMIKAGVCDPTRPFGVFLFAGPTGTGKTEIAKCLAAYLFGASERMIRLDMSEFKDPESIQRLIGGGAQDEAESEALVNTIRKQPFSVVLLDEFEKAHANIWDLFLQVFDDGRLTDRSGNTADFRNAIIILTSNLGSKIPAGASLGFADETGRFNEAAVHREVRQSFRPEFLNRIDRVVVFRPLDRETMREILRKELVDAFRRRGLRNREWAVEWDESALELLLERGFTADLGARPLRRAIERHVLAPLARTIVDHQYPEGDQFLFVRAESGRVVVEFVDPDAPDETAPADEEPRVEPGGSPPLGRIALDPRGRQEEMAALRAVHDRLRRTVEDEAWQTAKREGLARIGEAEFWRSDARFAVLGRVEYLDRVEAGVASAGSLLERLSGYGRSSRPRYPRDLLGRLASRLHLLDAACRSVREQLPWEAFVLVEAWSDGGNPSRLSDTFARRIGAMYRAWAERRRMQCDVLEEGDATRPYQLLLAVSGFGAYTLLASEHGLHVFEFPGDTGKKTRKAAVRVRVAPQPDDRPATGESLVRQARATVAATVDESLAIVRRYREQPSPLVRDGVRGWRTGKLDRVLQGDFDLLGDERYEPPDDA